MVTKGDQTTLVTGAKSFIVGHIIAQALAKGYKVSGTVRSEEAANKALKTFEMFARVVSTSSFAGVADLTQGLRPGYTHTDKDWAPFTYEFAKDAEIVPAYGASKALAEKAMWEFVEKEKVAPEVPPPDFPRCADVRDVAAAHIAAIEKADAAGKRFLTGNKFTYQHAVDIARETIPLRDRLPKGTPGAGKEVESYTLDKIQVEGLLGRALTPVATTITDTLTQLLGAKWMYFGFVGSSKWGF
ncbi:hypothetical protein V8C34DRAFT_327765 [Trichoderma compactum]